MTREDIYRIALPAALIGIGVTLVCMLLTIWTPRAPEEQDPTLLVKITLTTGFTSLALTGIALITKK